jgi:H+/Cl- antiporter ClcA
MPVRAVICPFSARVKKNCILTRGVNIRTSAQWRMVNSLLLATVLRAFLVVVSYGCRVPAGIFVPSMAVGATFGRMMGILVKAVYR